MTEHRPEVPVSSRKLQWIRPSSIMQPVGVNYFSPNGSGLQMLGVGVVLTVLAVCKEFVWFIVWSCSTSLCRDHFCRFVLMAQSCSQNAVLEHHPGSGLVLLQHVWFWLHKTKSVTLSFMKRLWAENMGVYYRIDELVFFFGAYRIILRD